MSTNTENEVVCSLNDELVRKANEMAHLLNLAKKSNDRMRGLLCDAFAEHREGCRGVSGEQTLTSIFGFIEKELGD